MTGSMGRRGFIARLAQGTMLGAVAIDGRLHRSVAHWLQHAEHADLARSSPHHIVIFGDSIAWGQGLREEQKYSTLVQNWLAQRLSGQRIVKWTFAHSGAVIGPDANDNLSPVAGEVPVPYPSVLAQLSNSTSYLAHHPETDADHAAPVSPESVSLVLVNGGINDVNVRDILTVDPTIADPESWIRGLARHRCVERMQDQLLPRLLSTFPNAQVIVTGYYAIVSPDTRLGDLEKLLDELGLLGELGALGVTELVRKKLASQCAAFADETTAGLSDVVPRAQPLQVIASASTSSAVRRPDAPAVAALQGQGQPQPPGRAHFVDFRMASDEAFGASQTKLWGLPASDPLAVEREQECNLLGASVDHLTCIEASAGHPNVDGARLLADRIIKRISCIMTGGKLRLPGATTQIDCVRS